MLSGLNPDERWLEDHAGTSLWSLIAAFFQMSELYLKRLQRVHWLPIR
jgi:hypothetical protein